MKVYMSVAMFLLVLGYLIASMPGNNLKIVICDVGQGDAAIVMKGSVQVVVDGGPGNRLLLCMGKHVPFWDKKVEMVVLSHAQEDHMGGLEELFKRYDIDLVVWNELGVENEKFYKIAEELEGKGVRVMTPKQGDEMAVGEMAWRVLWPEVRMDDGQVLGASVANKTQTTTKIDQNKIEKLSKLDINESSVVVEMQFGEFVGLFTGDIGHVPEEALVQSGLLRDITFLKIPHHGSKYSSSKEFLEAVKPEVGSISSRRGNSYGHPNEETLELLEAEKVRVLRTDEQGDIVVESDGESWWVK